MPFGAIWCHSTNLAPNPNVIALHDGLWSLATGEHCKHRSDHLLHALGELLHVLVGGGVRPRVPQVRLDVLH